MFGEHFLLVGNEAVIGMWNPSKAIPLNWSRGNIWTVELVRTLGIHKKKNIIMSHLSLHLK